MKVLAASLLAALVLGATSVTAAADRIRLLPDSEMAFFEKDSDRTFRFVKGAEGKVTSLVISVLEELALHKLP